MYDSVAVYLMYDLLAVYLMYDSASSLFDV